MNVDILYNWLNTKTSCLKYAWGFDNTVFSSFEIYIKWCTTIILFSLIYPHKHRYTAFENTMSQGKVVGQQLQQEYGAILDKKKVRS